MNISVHIERLILEDLPVTSSQEALVQAAVEKELEHLLTAKGLSEELHRGGALPGVRADAIHLTQENHPAQLGQSIARAVYKGIGK
jgi:hypothetical protein